jgi:hypothetical protein
MKAESFARILSERRAAGGRAIDRPTNDRTFAASLAPQHDCDLLVLRKERTYYIAARPVGLRLDTLLNTNAGGS